MSFKKAINKTIGTHSGFFHCDEALAVFMLKYTKEFKHASVIRSRKPERLANCDALIDVGGIYNPSLHRYDHHQLGFKETFSKEYKTKLSSAGLIYKHFGKEIIRNIFGAISPMEIDLIFEKVYKGFIESVDGNDNGIDPYPQFGPSLYRPSPTNIMSKVSRLNPKWYEQCTGFESYAKFTEASALAGAEFVDYVQEFRNSWIPARRLVSKALDNRYNVDASGRIVILDAPCPWRDHLIDFEEKQGLTGDKSILYVIYPNSFHENKWMVCSVSETPGSYTRRDYLPTLWVGVHEEDLARVSGIDDCIYVHETGFLGASRTLEGAYRMAVAALNK